VFVVLVVGVGGAWVGVRGLQAKSELESAQALVSQLKTQALKQDIPGATKTFKKLRVHSEKARELTSDPIWRVAEFVPVLGRNLTVVRELADVTNDVVVHAVGPLIQVASAVTPAALAPKDGAINLKPIQSAVAPVNTANKAIQSAVTAVDNIDAAGTISQLSAAKGKLSTLLGSVAPLMQTLHTVLPLLPPAMGSDGPRTYVVMFQNNAEARALGGTALSFASITVDKGKISPPVTVPAGLQNFPMYDSSVIPVPDGVPGVYLDTFGTFIANATVRPSFVSAAEITSTMWKDKFGAVPDGIISIDPVALSYFLRATGPIPLSSGDVLTDKTVVPLLLNEVYQRYNSGNIGKDNAAQDAIYREAVSATFAHLSGGKFDAKALIAAMVQGWSEQRLLFWSSHKDEQMQFVKLGLNGELPKSDKTTDRVGVYFQDAVGSKMDYYLSQNVHLSQAVCRADGRANYRVSINLTNNIPANAAKSISPSILGNWKHEKLKPGEQRMDVILYAPPGSTITGATVDGAAVDLKKLHDTDYPVGKRQVMFLPGATANVTYDIIAAKPGKKKLAADVTPMVHPTAIDTIPLDCATVAK
jgi:hypothetical protein